MHSHSEVTKHLTLSLGVSPDTEAAQCGPTNPKSKQVEGREFPSTRKPRRAQAGSSDGRDQEPWQAGGSGT